MGFFAAYHKQWLHMMLNIHNLIYSYSYFSIDGVQSERDRPERDAEATNQTDRELHLDSAAPAPESDSACAARLLIYHTAGY